MVFNPVRSKGVPTTKKKFSVSQNKTQSASEKTGGVMEIIYYLLVNYLNGKSVL